MSEFFAFGCLFSCQMGNYIRRVTLFAIGNTIREAVVTVVMGNYIRRVIVIGGSLYSRVYGILSCIVTKWYLLHYGCMGLFDWQLR